MNNPGSLQHNESQLGSRGIPHNKVLARKPVPNSINEEGSNKRPKVSTYANRGIGPSQSSSTPSTSVQGTHSSQLNSLPSTGSVEMSTFAPSNEEFLPEQQTDAPKDALAVMGPASFPRSEQQTNDHAVSELIWEHVQRHS